VFCFRYLRDLAVRCCHASSSCQPHWHRQCSGHPISDRLRTSRLTSTRLKSSDWLQTSWQCHQMRCRSGSRKLLTTWRLRQRTSYVLMLHKHLWSAYVWQFSAVAVAACSAEVTGNAHVP